MAFDWANNPSTLLIVHYGAYYMSRHSCNAKFASKKPKSILSVYQKHTVF